MVTPRHLRVPTQGSTLEFQRVQHQEVGPLLPSTQGPILQQPKPPMAKLCRLPSLSSCLRTPQIILSHGPCLRRTSSLSLGQATLFPPVALPQGHLYCMMLEGQLDTEASHFLIWLWELVVVAPTAHDQYVDPAVEMV